MKRQIELSGHLTLAYQDPEVLRRLDALEASFKQLGEQLMALGDDLKTSLTATSGKLDTAITAVGALNTEVNDLIGRLVPGDVVTQEMLDMANGVGTKTQAMVDALAAIKPEPA